VCSSDTSRKIAIHDVRARGRKKDKKIKYTSMQPGKKTREHLTAE
jgi:hypothetical protein